MFIPKRRCHSRRIKDIVEDIFDNNMPVEQPDGGFDLEPIDDGGTDETSYETVELELEIEIDFEIGL